MAQRTIQDIRNILAEDEFEYQQELDGVLVANVGREVEQSKKEVQHRIDTVAKGQVALKLQAKQEMAKLVGEGMALVEKMKSFINYYPYYLHANQLQLSTPLFSHLQIVQNLVL